MGKETFTCSGKTLISPGYTNVMTWQAISQDENLPQCSIGEECEITEVGAPSWIIHHHVINHELCFISGEALWPADISTGLLDRGRTHLSNGEAWHWDRCQHSCPYQQHLREELCLCDGWPQAETYNSWGGVGAWLSKSKLLSLMGLNLHFMLSYMDCPDWLWVGMGEYTHLNHCIPLIMPPCLP